MAEITRARTGKHLQALFAILEQHPDGIKADQALELLTRRTELTDYERGSYQSGGLRFEKIVRFATVDCVKAGWMTKTKGLWSITEEGKLARVRFPEPEKFYGEAVRLYRNWKRDRNEEAAAQDYPPSSEELTETTTKVTYEVAEEHAWSEIEEHLGKMPPYDFQDLVADLLRGLGYFVEWISPPGKDGGIDIIAHVDPLGTKPPRIKVQVKRVSAPIDVSTLNSFLATIESGDVGLYVATGGFTRDAKDAARKQSVRKITLIDLERLVDLWIEAYSKLDEKAKRRLPLTPIYFLAPEP